ncbi:MAG TPA: GntR family transcriptional regulator [Galbitalea sp.]
MPESRQPPLKHEHIVQVLGGEIRRGSMPRGRRLPGETALAERFSVSRNTVRAALSELGEAGLIATRSGKGSFVTFDGNPLDVELGWARALQDHGVATRVEVLNLDEINDPALAAELGETSDRFVVIDRLRSADGVGVISYERSRIPATPAVMAAVADGRAAGSLTQLLRDAELIAAQGEQWVEIRRLPSAEAELLGRAAGESFLWSRCVTRTAEGGLVENVESLLDPDHFRLHFQFAQAL